MDALLHRSIRAPVSGKAWSALLRDDLSTRVAAIAFKVAKAADRASGLQMSKSPLEVNVLECLDKMAKLESLLQQWLMSLYTSSRYQTLSPHDRPPYWLVSISTYDAFGSIGPASFPTVFEFPSFVTATSHCYIWICLVVLRMAVAGLATAHCPDMLQYLYRPDRLSANVDECANNLCKSVPYLAQTEFNSAGMLSCAGPLHFAAEWFELQHEDGKLEWINQVRAVLRREARSSPERSSMNLQNPVFGWWMLPLD